MPSHNQLANAIRALTMDAVQRANSGHPGAPMGMADIAEVLWNNYHRHNPNNTLWPNRDRFVLSNGHGSMLLYALLHLTGYSVSIEDIKRFRQLHSNTPGHPEYGDTPGIETTTGPLGQGIGNAVGMALAEKMLAAQFNRPGYDIVDHYTYVFLGDGCLMEGISHEVCSLAGTLGLGKLIVFYDDNGISIDGDITGWFTDDTPVRFEAYGWQVVTEVDGHDRNAIKMAIDSARANTNTPTLICCKTMIGFGSPNKQGRATCHGSALGTEEVALTRAALDWPHPPFAVPADIYRQWDARSKGERAESHWQELLNAYSAAYPELAAEFKRRVIDSQLPTHFDEAATAYIHRCQQAMESIPSRKASQNCLNTFGPLLPEIVGGSADLAGSNLTLWSGSKPITADDATGNYIYYGVREFGMSAVMSGIALHGGFINYGATFLVFMEYAHNAVRMAALMKQQNIFVYTHDSIGVGEDGPTHQPVEQLAALRLIPGLNTWRPCDAVESAVAWRSAIEYRDGPTALVFSRQELTPQQRTDVQVDTIAKGGYVLKECRGKPELIMIATGSEVGIAVIAATTLSKTGVAVRVVSMPCTEIFSQQDVSYREAVLPPDIDARLVIEAGHADYWYKFVGIRGRVVGMTTFGQSAPGHVLMEHFGFTVDKIVAAAEALLQDHRCG